MKKLLMMIVAAADLTAKALAAAVAVGALLPFDAYADASPRPSTLVDLTTSDAGSVSTGDYSTTAVKADRYNGTKAFDGGSGEGSRWLAENVAPAPMYVIYTFKVATVVDAIQLFIPAEGAPEYSNRAPKVWTFLGSDDKSSWDVLDTQDSETDWETGESRYYKFANTKAYKYYKFNCTALNGDSATCLQLQEIEFYCVGTANSTWTGGGATDLMSDVVNWGGTSMPGSGYDAYIENTGATPAVVPGGLTVYKFLRVGHESGNSAKVVQTNGTLRTLNGGAIGRAGGVGEYSISGGKFAWTGASLFMCPKSGKNVGVIDISGNGEVESDQKILMCWEASAGSTATIKISDNGKLTLGHDLDMGNGNNATTGMVYQTGGTFKETNSILVGNNNKSYGEYKMLGGTCSATYVFIGYLAGSSGLFEMTGGTCAVSEMMSVGRLGTGTLAVSGAGTVVTANTVRVGWASGSTKGTGTLVVTNSGEIAATKFFSDSKDNATVVFDGAKLTATAANAEFMKDLLNIQLGDGGLTIDTQGKNLGINNCTFNVTGNGKITVVGGGTVTFTDVTLNLPAKPSCKYVFAEIDGTFSGLPNLGGVKGCKISLSDDFKRVTVSPRGFIITVF